MVQGSHSLTNSIILLLTQIEDVLDGKETHFILRKNKNADGALIQWPDSCCDDYRWRHNSLKNMCLYEFTMTHEKKIKIYRELERENDISNYNDEDNEDRLDFEELHPGHQFSYLTKLKHHVVPKISMTANKLCDIECLKLRDDDPGAETLQAREGYGKVCKHAFYSV